MTKGRKDRAVRLGEVDPRRRKKVKGIKLALKEGRYSSMERIQRQKIPQRMLGDVGLTG